MGHEGMPSMRPKTKEELASQLVEVQTTTDTQLLPDADYKQAFTMSPEELKEKHPSEYQAYLEGLRNVFKQFPIFEKYAQKEKPQIFELRTGARRKAFKIAFSDQSYVIKALENKNEQKIADIAAELGVGPQQFETKTGYLTEEWLEGNLIAKLKPELCTSDYMQKLGREIGTLVKKLHEKNIVINDQLLRDDFGKSHTIISENREVHFIDFGAAVDVSHFPELSNTEIFSLMRSDPMVAMAIYGKTETESESEIKQYQNWLLDTFKTKEELIQGRDYKLLSEGIHFLGDVLPHTDSFQKGLKETLRS